MKQHRRVRINSWEKSEINEQEMIFGHRLLLILPHNDDNSMVQYMYREQNNYSFIELYEYKNIQS